MLNFLTSLVRVFTGGKKVNRLQQMKTREALAGQSVSGSRNALTRGRQQYYSGVLNGVQFPNGKISRFDESPYRLAWTGTTGVDI